MTVNHYGIPLHACNGYRHDAHWWAWVGHKAILTYLHDDLFRREIDRTDYASKNHAQITRLASEALSERDSAIVDRIRANIQAGRASYAGI